MLWKQASEVERLQCSKRRVKASNRFDVAFDVKDVVGVLKQNVSDDAEMPRRVNDARLRTVRPVTYLPVENHLSLPENTEYLGVDEYHSQISQQSEESKGPR